MENRELSGVGCILVLVAGRALVLVLLFWVTRWVSFSGPWFPPL